MQVPALQKVCAGQALPAQGSGWQVVCLQMLPAGQPLT
jgi:hypothetical protein